ncbi:hypothetical protein D9M68_939040 [compost metagenome]
MTPPPSAPNDPHRLRSAAGELATARNMLGVAPKAPWMSASKDWASPVAAVSVTRLTRGMKTSFR